MGRMKKDMQQIRQRGNSYLVTVFAGNDPLTGKRLYFHESTKDLEQAYKIRDRMRAQVAEQRSTPSKASFRHAFNEWLKTHEIEETTRETYEMYMRRYYGRAMAGGRALADEPLTKINAKTLEEFYAHLRRCSQLCDGSHWVEHLDQEVDGEHVCRLVKHRRPPGRKPAGGYPPHDCKEKGCKVSECKPHVCKGLSNSTILKIHFTISGLFNAAMRWEWVSTNPADIAKKPRQPTPRPKPPSVSQASKIVEAAFAQDLTWGTMVWLVMVTGMRRAEALALRWRHFDLEQSTMLVDTNHMRARGRTYEKGTKTHQERGLALDEATVELLMEHRQRYEDAVRRIGIDPTDDAYLFSHEPTFDRPYSPDAVTHRYSDMCEEVGIDTSIKNLRHYSATELLQGGTDIRTVAGRLGHGGGGSTTLRVYTAWTSESDRRAANLIGSRLKKPNSSPPSDSQSA